MKRACSLIIVLLLSALLCVNSYAAFFRVYDNADYMTQEETDALEDYLSSLRQKDKFDIVIVTEHYIDDLETYADDFYDINGYGVGAEKDGLILLVTDYGSWLSTCGIGIDAVDPYLSELSSDFRINVDEGGYYFAFEQFADSVSECVTFEREAAENETGNDYYGTETDLYDGFEDIPEIHPGSVENHSFSDSGSFRSILNITAIAFVTGLVAALIIVAAMKARHMSVAMKKDANSFIVRGSFNLTDKRDYLVSRNVTRTAKPKDDSGSSTHSGGSGGSISGGTHTSSSGVTHGGGAF